jgi:Uma2 family endonuclease
MTQIAIRSGPHPVNVQLGPKLRLDEEELFELCRRNPELQIERTATGDLIVMTPAGGESSYKNARIVAALTVWAERDGGGVVFDSSGGFILPNGAMRSPDAAWLARPRLAGLSAEQKQRFLPLCPDFVIELRSLTDSLADLQAKMEEYRDNGARLGWLIDPEKYSVHVYRPGKAVETLVDPARIAADPELPGFTLDLAPIWQPL